MSPQVRVFRAHRAIAWFYALVGVGVMAAIGLGSGHIDLAMLPMLIVFVIVFLVHYLTGRACLAGKAGGRYASIVISCLLLVGFPIGTLIGIYLLSNTWRPWDARGQQAAG